MKPRLKLRKLRSFASIAGLNVFNQYLCRLAFIRSRSEPATRDVLHHQRSSGDARSSARSWARRRSVGRPVPI